MAAVSFTDRSQEPVTFEDIDTYFTEDEWTSLGPTQRTLFRDVMLENCAAVDCLALATFRPALMAQLEQEEEPYDIKWQEARREAGLAGYNSKIRSYTYVAKMITHAVKLKILEKYHF